MYNKTIGNYYQTNSLIHKLNPFYKIISVIITIIMIVMLNSFIDYVLLLLYLITIMVWSNIDIKIYLKNIYTIRILLIILLILGIFFPIILTIMIKIIYLLILLSILTLTTPPMEITYGVEKLLRIFNKILPINEMAISLTLIFRFIPIVTEVNEKINYTSTLRGIENKKALIKPTLKLSLKKIKELKKMMSLRLYNYSYTRVNYRLNKWMKIDTMLLVLNVVMIMLVIIY